MRGIKRPSGASVGRKMRGFPTRNARYETLGFFFAFFFLRFFCFGGSSINSSRLPGVSCRPQRGEPDPGVKPPARRSGRERV